MLRFSLYLLSVLFSSAVCLGAVIETKQMAQVLNYTKDDTLYVFDLDNTLIAPPQHLGSDQWVTHMLERLVQQGLTTQEALRQVIPRWNEIHEKTEMQLVDPFVPDLLSQLKKKGISCIGPTKREPASSKRTLEQLQHLRISFHPLVRMEQTFDHLNNTLYKQGVIFVGSGIEKGPCLVAYLKTLPKLPAQIVVIDDKMSHVLNIEEALKPLKIPFVGIRYAGSDEKVQALNPQIADLQMEHLNKILSDEEALHLMKMKRS